MPYKKQQADEYYKSYYEKNRELVLIGKQQYYINNTDMLKQKQYDYRINNQEKINARVKVSIQCVCGGRHKKYNIQQHLLTFKHIDYMNTLTHNKTHHPINTIII